METQIVERFVAPEEEGFYLRVPFQVPEGVERIRISYTYRKNENIIDIGLCSPEGKVIGWAGSNRDNTTSYLKRRNFVFLREIPIRTPTVPMVCSRRRS